jgi:hypothetical protein
MNLFNILNSILYSKKKLELNLEDENIFIPYMINRWVSMYNGDLAVFINNFFNKSLPFECKESYFDYYFNLCPKLKFKKIDYIKKSKKEGESDEIPKREFLSEREMMLYVDILQK